MRYLLLSLALVVLPAGVAVGEDKVDIAAVAEAIRVEAGRGNDDPAGRPLPLSAHWNSGHDWHRRGMTPAFQVSLVEAGHHHLPGMHLPIPGSEMHDGYVYYEAAAKRLAELRLPFCMEATQWESLLTTQKRWFDLPPEANPNVVTTAGKINKAVSPFGPVEAWRECGGTWTADRELLARLADWYPNPPRVMFLSNNEHSTLRWHQAETSKRYIDLHGKGKDANFKRKVFAEGWKQRYRALQGGMRAGLPNEAWRTAAFFVGYEAFGPAHFARWGGWDGGSPSYYVHNWNPSTDHTVWGPAVESMNWVFMLDDAMKLNPDFWWEISLWDGHQPTREDDMRKVYKRKGQVYGPPRYEGFLQFGMWLLRPRAVREFRGWTDTREEMMPYFSRVMAAVDRIYASETLQRFWRKGRLVPVRDVQHPYQQKVPEIFAKRDRWFLLNTSEMPARPWKLDTVIPVFAIALELGDEKAEAGREWLIYAHAPLGDKKGVTITLPGFGDVKADVTVEGKFIHVTAKDRRAEPLEL